MVIELLRQWDSCLKLLKTQNIYKHVNYKILASKLPFVEVKLPKN